MDSITGNTINSYNYNYVNNTNIDVKYTDTSSSNSTAKNTVSSNDTIKISTDNNTAFFKTVNELSSEKGTFQAEDCTVCCSEAFLTATQMMKNSGYNVPSFDSSCASYSSFIDKMKDFLSSSSDSFSTNVIDFCDDLKERLNMYGIN